MSKIIEGNLPLTIENQNTEKIRNYWIYGTADGAGVETESGEPAGYKLPITVTSEEETENLWDDSAVILNEWISSAGVIDTNNLFGCCMTNRIPVSEGETVAFMAYGTGFRSMAFAVYDENDAFIRRDFFTSLATAVYTYQNGDKHIIIYAASQLNITTSVLANLKPLIVKNSTPPDHYIPYRYSTTTPIYIGDAKLGAEEYVDYESGKVWKLRDNLFDAEQIVEDSVSTASTYIKDGWLCYNTGPRPITINVDGQVGETFQFKLWAKNFNTTSQNNIRFILEYEDGTTVITGSNSFAAGTERYVQFTSNSAKALKRVISQNTSNRSAGIKISKTLIVKSDTMPETYLQPTDSPVVLPTLSLYKGTNTLSSTTELGKVIIDYSVPEVSKIQLENQLYNLIDKDFYNIIANSYNSSLTYNEGDYCIYNYQLYKCISAISIPEDFDSEKWSQITLAESLRGD